MLSLYAFGKWAVVATVIVGWCYWVVPAIVREAGNPALTCGARKQILILTGICAAPLLATLLAVVWLGSPGDDAFDQTSSARAQVRLPPDADPDVTLPPVIASDAGANSNE